MAEKKVQNVLNLEIVAGKANPAPPLGPMLGANGVNIGEFTKNFNSRTVEYVQQFQGADVKVKCKLTVYKDRSFDLDIGYPVTSSLILWKLKQNKGSGEPNKEIIGTLTKKDLEEIVEIKRDDFNANDMDAAVRIVAGTCKNMGIKVE